MLKLLVAIPGILFTASIYTYTLPGSFGSSQINLADCPGKKILIVNTSSNSQFVSQYGGLEQLYQLYKDSLTIIAVPSNSFGNEQEDDSTISNFVSSNYHITYLLSAKIEVTGENIQSLYHWLTDKYDNGVVDNVVKGDFQKFLIDGTGNLIGVFAPSVDPMSDEMQDVIKGLDN